MAERCSYFNVFRDLLELKDIYNYYKTEENELTGLRTDNKIDGFVWEKYSFSGGTHPSTVYDTVNINPSTGAYFSWMVSSPH